MTYLFSYIDSKFPEIIPHFLYHYIDYLGIKNHEIILHSEKNDSNRKLCIKYFNRYNITATIVDSYSSLQKKETVNKFIKTLDDNDWLIYPDVDEFFCYPNILPEFLYECDKDDVTIVRGIFLDRISHDKELKVMNNEESIWQQFPYELSCGGLSQLFETLQHKIVALKAKYEYDGSHWVKEEQLTRRKKIKYRHALTRVGPAHLLSLASKTHKYFHELLPIYHFRCDQSLYEKTKGRINKTGNYDNIESNLKFYKKINSHIIKKDHKSFLDIPNKVKPSLILHNKKKKINMVPIYHDTLRATREWEYHKENNLLSEKFIIPENLLVIGSHNHQEKSFLEIQMEEYKCDNYVCMHLDIHPWSNTLRLIPYLKYLESEKARDKEYVMFLDADDVFISQSPDEVLDTFINEFDCDLLFNATRFDLGYWKTKESRAARAWAREIHKGWYLNAGAYIGKKDFVIKVFKEVIKYVTDDDLSAKKWYNNEKLIEHISSAMRANVKVDKSLLKWGNAGINFPMGCGTDQAILRHIEHRFYPSLQIDSQNKIFFRLGQGDLDLQRDLLRRPERPKRKFFIDCGGNTGQSIRKFKSLKKYEDQNYKIFSFEPNFDLIKDYAKNNPRDKIINSAVWVKNEKINLYLDRHDGDGSSLLTEKIHPHGHKENDLDNPLVVEAIDFSEWILKNFKKEDYIILKMDIEGAEYAVLEKMIEDGSMKYIDELYIEWHYKKVSIDEARHNEIKEKVKKVCPKVHGEFLKGSEHLNY